MRPLLLLYALLNVVVAQASSTRPNVLFIAVDDLNHWVGHLDGHPGTLTPNIDRLASQRGDFQSRLFSCPTVQSFTCQPAHGCHAGALRSLW